MMNFDYDKLNNLRIHELRDLARNVGVKSPTSMKKEDIITQILLILSGENKPYVNATKQGRPTKSLNKINDLVGFIVPNSQIANSKDIETGYNLQNDSNLEFLVNAPSAYYNGSVKSDSIESGYLDLNKNGYGIIRTKGFLPNENDILIHLYSVKTYGLKNGDVIEGEVKFVQEGRPRVMTKVLKINNVPVDNHYPNKDFEKMPYNASSVKINSNEKLNKLMNGATLFEGSRNLVLKEKYESVQDIVASFETGFEDYEIFVLNLNSKPEEDKFNLSNVNLVNLPFYLNESAVFGSVSLVIENAKRKVEQGKKVVVVINKLGALIKVINNIDNKEYLQNLQTQTIHKIKNLILCAKNVNEKQNLTLILLDTINQETYLTDFIKYDFSNLF